MTKAVNPADLATHQPAHAGDAHWGKGGRYVVIDGKRVPADAAANGHAAPAAAVASDQFAKKGK